MAEWSQAANGFFERIRSLPEGSLRRKQLLATMLRSNLPLSTIEEVLREYLRIEPSFADGWQMLGETLAMQGRSAEGVLLMQRGAWLDPSATRHSRWLLGLQYVEVTPDLLLAAHREWGQLYSGASAATDSTPTLGSLRQGPLRIGFVSPDFGRHAVGFLLLDAFERIDRSECSIVCYSDRVTEDDYTDRFRARADDWRNIRKLADESVCQLVRADQVEVLIDLDGHAGRRLGVFARRPAPVQVSWLGYVGTTGLPSMDFLLADRFHIPPGEEQLYTERVIRLPNCYACFSPPPDAPAVGTLPTLTGNPFTFGCLNNPVKYSERMLDVWAQILRRSPSARLLLKYRGLDDPQVQEALRVQFNSRHIDGARVLIEGGSFGLEFLTNYNRVDLALDTQPYSGGATTCEALWMGVPVVTMPGATFAGRHSTSYLSNIGMHQFVAPDREAYIDVAVDWSNRIAELALIRNQLRDSMRRSPVCDSRPFADEFLSILKSAVAQKRVT